MNPKYVEIDGKKYKINTDFRVAIECNNIYEDITIGNYEKALAIIYLLYGDKGLDDIENHAKLLELGQRFLACDKEIEITKKEPDIDFNQDMEYIEASFMSDFHIDLENQEMHWWKFMKLMNGLSNSELGNCCILNNIRNLRNFDPKTIKDDKQRQKIIEAQQTVALKKNKKQFTLEEEDAIEKFNKLAGL